MPNTQDIVIIYTDGACSGNPGPGGWGAILMYNQHKLELSGGEKETTNNRMELTAVIQALTKLNRSCHIHIYTDSKYVLEGATKWLSGWKEKGWKNSQRKEVLNKDLWLSYDNLSQSHKIEWTWVKGHAGDPLNERADQLAVNAIPK